MKVLFVSDLGSVSASGSQRLWAMKQCGVEILPIDKHLYLPIFGRWSNQVAKFLRMPEFLKKTDLLESHILSECLRFRPDIIWFEWALEFRVSFFKELHNLEFRPFLISFQDDNPWGERIKDLWMWSNYFKLIPEFDLHVVKRQKDIENLSLKGGKNFYVWKHGVYKPIFRPFINEFKKKYPVSFVGTCMDQRVELITYLLEHKIEIHIFGNKWEQRSNLPRRFPKNFHQAVEGTHYSDVINYSQVCLGLVSHSNLDEWTMRTYEVPGCAGTLLAERTPFHDQLFIEGLEADFFSSNIECLEKLSSLLEDPERCQRIGYAAYNKCYSYNWTIEFRMLELIKELELIHFLKR